MLILVNIQKNNLFLVKMSNKKISHEFDSLF